MNCPDPAEASELLLESLRSNCKSFKEELMRIKLNCRTPTRMRIPKSYLARVGDMIGRSMLPEELPILECWCEIDDEGRVVLALALSRLAMSFPEEVQATAKSLGRCGGRELLAKWVYPILALWDTSLLDSLDRQSYLMSWAWLAYHAPEDFDLALEKVMVKSDVIDETLVKALKVLRRVNPAKTYERIKGIPYLLSRVIP